MSPSVTTDCEWIIAAPQPERDRLAREARISPLLAQILLNREVRSAADVRRFLSPGWSGLLPPEALPGAVEAAELLARAVRDGRRIVVYGDYDVDGISATAILWHVLAAGGADVHYFVPNRFEEGYGVSAEALRGLRKEGADVVVTVDCGITARAEARLARELGLTLVITDHHEPRSELPQADAIVHPTALEVSENPHLSGSAVAFKVAWATARALCGAQRVGEEFRTLLTDATAFAALGLVADVVPLIGENRLIAALGLAQLRHTENPGLRALIEVSGLADRRRMDEYDIGFMLAPRLNAIGRLGHAAEAVELFTHADGPRARTIAADLDAKNRERQRVEKRITQEAHELVLARGFHRESCRAIVLASPEWHRGVVGIVASRLVDRYRRPTVLIALDGAEGQGSGRSIRHFPLHEALSACEAHLLSHGGHAMAAGVRIAADQVEPFTQAFLALAAQRLTPADMIPKLRLDDEVELGQIGLETVELLQHMAPFGTGNARPRLASTPVELVGEPRAVGQAARHLQFTVRQGSVYRKAIAFGRGNRRDELLDHRRLRLAFEPIVNEWNGRRSVELKIVDWKPA